VGRHRTFNAVFYPESAPENFREIIDDWKVPALLALHDQDQDKKPHYHLTLLFTRQKTLAQVHALVDQLGSSVVQPAYDTRASCRYLAHLDHPEKFQYGVGVLESFAGASVPDLTQPAGDPSLEILAWIRDQGVIEYSDLIHYCADHRQDWYRWAAGHSIYLCAYLRSIRHKRGEDR